MPVVAFVGNGGQGRCIVVATLGGAGRWMIASSTNVHLTAARYDNKRTHGDHPKETEQQNRIEVHDFIR